MDTIHEHTLRTTIALVNSGLQGSGAEQFNTVDDIRDFITAWTITEVEPPTIVDLEALRGLRKRLRPVFVAPSSEEKFAIVNGLLASAPISPRLVRHDTLGIHIHYFPPQASLADHLNADCAMALADLLAAGDGDRLRLCLADDCARVLVDFSRNKSRRYCDSQRCGNRKNAAAYRARLRQ